MRLQRFGCVRRTPKCVTANVDHHGVKVLEKRPKMKTTKQSGRRSTPREDTKKTDEGVSLSPERIRDGTSAKTEVLNEMLEREHRSYHLRHWGINE